MWKKWKLKLQEFEKWRTKKRSIFGLKHGEFLLKEFLNEVPTSSRKGELCLEIGCGGGGILCPLVKDKFFAGIGLDPILESSIKILKSRVHEEKLPIHPILGVGEYLPLRNSTIKAVIIAATLDHVADPSKVLKESYRVLSKEGDLLLLQIIVKEKRENRTHLRQFMIGELYDLFYENNFKVKKIKLFYNLHPRPLHILKLLPKLYNFLGKLTHNPSITVIKAKKYAQINNENRDLRNAKLMN